MKENQDILFVRIDEACKECSRHVERINRALAKIEHYFPLSEDVYNSFDENDIDWFDQLIYRYTKLQDKIGEILIKNICIMLEGESLSYRRTFIDYLNILEAHGIIENTAVWENLRQLRNELTHEYNNDCTKQVFMLNNLKNSISVLIDIFSKIEIAFQKYH